MGKVASYCPLCGNNPTAFRVWCAIIEQPVCQSCSDLLDIEIEAFLANDFEGEKYDILLHSTDISGLPIAECVAVWLLKEIDRHVEDFRACYEFGDFTTESWTRPMIGELLCRMNEIDALSRQLCHPTIKETPQAKHHRESRGIYFGSY